MTIAISERASHIRQSEIRAMSMACKKYDGLNLSQGVCDTETPDIVLQSAKNAIDHGYNSYTQSIGITALRNAIALKEHQLKGVDLNPEEEIVVSSGATGAFYAALLATLNPGDEAVVFEPFYGYHISTLQALNIKINYVRLEGETWDIPFDKVEAAITDKTKAIIINTPGNPSGKVWTHPELECIGKIAAEKDLIIFSDEIYEYFVYGDRAHISPISLPELRERTIVVGGFSKTFSITGWRVGYTLAPPHVSKIIAEMSDLVYVCAPSPLQTGVTEGILTLSEGHYKWLRDDHYEKREKICGALADAGFTPSVPDGAYYLLADFSSIEAGSSRDRAITFLKETGIAGVPGSAFFHDNSGDHLIRFCFAKEMAVIDEVCKRIKSYRG